MPEHLATRPLHEATPRKSWTPPQIEDLPCLDNLALQGSVASEPVAVSA